MGAAARLGASPDALQVVDQAHAVAVAVL